MVGSSKAVSSPGVAVDGIMVYANAACLQDRSRIGVEAVVQ